MVYTDILKFCTLVPLTVCIFYWTKQRKALQLLGLFLVWELLNDWKRLFFTDPEMRQQLYIFYVLTEVMFYTWLLFQLGGKAMKPRLLKLFLVLIAGFWAVSFFVLEDKKDSDMYSSLYDGVTAAFLSCLSAYLIFKLTESRQPLSRVPEFWFAGGIFTYFFCNIFIFSIMSKEVADSVWLVHNIFNVAHMFFFVPGFYFESRRNGAKPVLS